jgi:nucleoside-diphosphate-sugar epimerase
MERLARSALPQERMKIFITGANGFIGSNLCRYFLDKDWDVYGLVRTTSDLHFLEGLNVKLFYGDLLKPEAIEIPGNITHIVHSASIVSDLADEDTCYRNIYLLAVNLVQRIRELQVPLKRLAYISTALTIGINRRNISEENPGDSAESIAYTRYKIKTEKYFREQWEQTRLPIVILRPADVYGPNDRITCGRLLRVCEKGSPLIVGRGHWQFGYCYVGNLCQAVHLALTKEGVEGKAYTVTNSELPTWKAFFKAIQKALGKKQRLFIPAWVAFTAASLMQFVHKIIPKYDPPLTRYRIRRVTTDTTYDISKTIAELGYEPDNQTERQIEEIVAWYREEREHGFIR